MRYDDDIRDLEMKDGCFHFSAFVIVALIVTFAFSCIIKCFNDEYKPITSPVEEINKIDSLNEAIKEIQKDVNKLDSEKHDTIEKVKTLSNDSTLELFRELVRE